MIHCQMMLVPKYSCPFAADMLDALINSGLGAFVRIPDDQLPPFTPKNSVTRLPVPSVSIIRLVGQTHVQPLK
jgi:hypothetical protein